MGNVRSTRDFYIGFYKYGKGFKRIQQFKDKQELREFAQWAVTSDVKFNGHEGIDRILQKIHEKIIYSLGADCAVRITREAVEKLLRCDVTILNKTDIEV